MFNDTTGTAVVAPITKTTPMLRLHAELPADMTTSGSVLVHQMRAVDYASRNISYKESCSEQVIKDVQSFAKLILS